MDIDSVRPINDQLLMRKCGRGDDLGDGRGIMGPDGKPLLYFDETHSDTTDFYELIDIGPGVDAFENWMCQRHRKNGEEFGAIVVFPESVSDKIAHIMYVVEGKTVTSYWEGREEMVPPVLFNEKGKSIYPIGDTVLLRMDQSLEERQRCIDIPDDQVMQSQWADVAALGPDCTGDVSVCDRVFVSRFTRSFRVGPTLFGTAPEGDIFAKSQK